MRASTLLIAGALTSAVTMLGAGTAAAAPADTIPGDGVYLVGTDILPGLWESTGTPDPARGCDWRRLWKVEGDNTDMGAIIANNYTRISPVRVEIKATDTAFKTTSCGSWRLVPRPNTGSFGG
ncbi:hypothetical protein [Nocardia callitridis]|uniref:Secreted protein n=1 Tax=Nocardia callitridis TaxID=648753 RepID=A0ABP9KP53_9NOCA